MYFLFGFLFLACLFFMLWFHRRKKYVICHISRMDCRERVRLLDELLEPFGFVSCPAQNMITSTLNAWQRQFGYCALYDRSAAHFGMVFDCLPVYFEWNGRTCLIELWKGQYGLNLGAEIGFYEADSLLHPSEYDQALFHSIPNDRLPSVSLELLYKGASLFCISRPHWWLTGFCPGLYTEPEDLSMNVSIEFPDQAMLQGFYDGLLRAGFYPCELCVCGLAISFCYYAGNRPSESALARLTERLSQHRNRLFCRLYRFVTRDFSCTVDKILYLYFFLPFSFSHAFLLRRNRRQRFDRERRGVCRHQHSREKKRCFSAKERRFSGKNQHRSPKKNRSCSPERRQP